ncbi:MAG TPA: histidine phosphatase family protein [Gaiellaceae bacterium]|nr:histidine phosphatase family protein [Gaiellaceae bacterium]
MELYLVRHAEAARGDPDELRPLTPAGREQARSLGERLRRDGVRPDVILTSPLLRARETGELLARELGAASRPDERLAPGATAAATGDGGDTVVVVAQQPDCGQIAAELRGGQEPAFPPAGVAAITL